MYILYMYVNIYVHKHVSVCIGYVGFKGRGSKF